MNHPHQKERGTEAKLCFTGHTLKENRNGLVVNVCVTQATGTCEREPAIEMLEKIPGDRRITVGADKAYDAKSFVTGCRELNATLHVA